ncbi:hypothetical protein M3M33_14370, partial [Loigolactobacillus coryniformis]|uniref:hypothetical protein n=1 Tax=Loigolactobacillus coryniformis TaxID=1610 RepID=UPI00201B27B3
LHKFSSSTGNLVGFLSTMMGGAKALQGLNLVKDAEAANKISMAMDMYSGIEKEETKNNPDNPLLAKLSAGIQTGVWMKFNETLPKLARG